MFWAIIDCNVLRLRSRYVSVLGTTEELVWMKLNLKRALVIKRSVVRIA